MKKKIPPKNRNSPAHSLEDPKFRQRKVRSKKDYNRKKDKADDVRETKMET